MTRIKARNAIRAAFVLEFEEALADAERDPEVRAIVITGTDATFCAGGDVKEMGQFLASGTPDIVAARKNIQRFHQMMKILHGIEKPVIAAVNGTAFGAGCNLALCCDLRIASEKATFCWAFVQRGLSSDAGSTYVLQRLVGYPKAFELLALGDTIDAQTALSLGIVSEVVPHDQLRAAAQALADRFADGPPSAIGLIKRGLHGAAVAPLSECLENEANLQSLCFGGKEFMEGVTAFLEKREPKF